MDEKSIVYFKGGSNYNRVHNIWEFYKVLEQVPLSTSKTRPDI